MKIVTIVGARPQFIKAATVSRVIATHNRTQQNKVQEIIIHTGQHYDDNMSDIFFSELNIPFPDYNLGIGSGRHGKQTGRMLEAIEEVILEEKPDWVLVYGDTNSTIAGSLAAAKLHIKLAHVEAGLRSFNRKMPEEINRIVTDHIADVLFTPTELAEQNLVHEGVPSFKIYMVGDVMYDAALFYGKYTKEECHILDTYFLRPGQYILTTIHGAENTDDSARLRAIVRGLLDIAKEYKVVLPLHPRTKAALIREGLYEVMYSSLIIIPPVGYLDMMMLEKNSRLIVTDSGGVQKEAYFYKVPCLTLRDETEWVELIDSGWNRLLQPVDQQIVADGIRTAIDQKGNINSHLYGNGDASIKILHYLMNYGLY